MWMLIVIFILCVMAVLYDIATYNSFVFLRQKAREAWSGIDVQLKRRHDLIPQVVSVVKGYTKHEQDLFERVTRERTAAMQADARGRTTEVAQTEGSLFNDVKKILALAESYPELQANKNFLTLQEEISETEDQISAARGIYNQNANIFNINAQSFPSMIVAKLHGFKRIDLFEMK